MKASLAIGLLGSLLSTSILTACALGSRTELTGDPALSPPALRTASVWYREHAFEPPPARMCKVNTPDCDDLDSRPFGACLLSDKRCPQTGEFVQLRGPGGPSAQLSIPSLPYDNGRR
jgi:hypothetical protein